MYIIVGASSFIGVYTADEFVKQGFEIIVTGRNNKFKEHYDKLGVKYVNLDLTNEVDFEQLPKDGVDGVILLSGLLPANVDVNLDVDDETADDLYDTRGGKSKYSAVAYYLEDMSMTENYMPITAHMPQDCSVKKVFTTDKIELYYDGEYGNYFAIFRDSFKSWYEQLNLVDNSELYQI